MTTATLDGTTPEKRPRPLLRRWPTALALALSLPDLVGGGPDEGEADSLVGTFGEALPLLPLLYVIVQQLGRPRLTWPVLGAGLALMVTLRAQDLLAPSVVLTTVALAVLVAGAVRGSSHGPAVFRFQAAGALLFCLLAPAGLAVDPDVGLYLVAAGWFCHGVWDFAHLTLKRLDGIVSRTFAEWCAVIDVCVALQLLLVVH